MKKIKKEFLSSREIAIKKERRKNNG